MNKRLWILQRVLTGTMVLGLSAPFSVIWAASIGNYEHVSLAMAKTHTFLKEHSSPNNPVLLPSPLESLKHDNLRQLERKTGPLFGRFYDERTLLNSPPVQNERNAVNFLEMAIPAEVPVQKPEKQNTPIDQKIKATQSPHAAISSDAQTQVVPVSTAVDTRAVASPASKKARFGLPGWVQRLRKIDDPVNEIQLFLPQK